LLGEHAVVYGVPAIAAGIGAGATATARRVAPGEPAGITLGERSAVAADGSELGSALQALLDSLEAPPCAIRVDLAVPAGCGLGASAAIAVATARAVVGGERESPVGAEPPSVTLRVLRAADAWERVYHGNPSGIDAAAAAHGGALLFRRGEGSQRIRLRAPLNLAIAIAGPPASTKEMVESVAMLRQRRPEVVERTLAAIDSLVRNARLHLEDHNLAEVGQLLDLNHMLLSGLMLSTTDIERAVTVARGAGALGAKLTGSGGGGAVIALVEEAQPVLTAWEQAGFTCFATTVEPDVPSVVARESAP
jgi:mevalonate kinase